MASITSSQMGSAIAASQNAGFRLTWLELGQLAVLSVLLTAPFQVYLNVGAAPIAIGYVGVLIGAGVMVRLLAGRGWRLYASPLLLPLFLLAVATVLTIPRVQSWEEFSVKTLHLILQVLFYVVVLNVVAAERSIRQAVRVTLYTGVASALVGILLYILINVAGAMNLAVLLARDMAPLLYGARGADFFAGGGFFSWVRVIPGQTAEIFRATALFVTPGENGFFSSCILLLALGLRRSIFGRHPRLWLAVIGASMLNIALTQTRGVWVGVGVGLLYYGVQQRIWSRQSRLVPLATGSVLVAVIVLVTVGTTNLFPLFQSVLSREDSSSESRISTMQEGIQILSAQTALIGLGPGNGPGAVGQEESLASTTHSLYLDIGVAVGGIGLLAYLWLMALSWQEARGIRRHSESVFLRELAAGYQCMWLAVMAMGVFQGNLFGNPKTNLMLWGVIGLVSSARRIVRKASVAAE